MIKQQDDSFDEEFTKIMDKFDVHYSVSKTLAHLLQGGTHRSIDIEKHTGLRQPEVSKATNELTKLGWIDKTKEYKIGKGRPIYHYQLNKDIDEIFSHFQQQKQQEIKQIKKLLQEIQEYTEILKN